MRDRDTFPDHPVPTSSGSRRLGLVLGTAWTLVVALSLTWNLLGERREMREAASEAARTNLLKDVTYRSWNADHGGVYAPATETTTPNPHLDAAPQGTHHGLREQRRARWRILLAEDNITNQQVARAILHKLGMRCDVAADGREAVAALESLPYDLVLMDVNMPEMDGLEATRAVRAFPPDAPNRSVPIVAMTALAMEGDREMCLEAGMDDYLPKPVTPASLTELLERWFDEVERSRSDELAGAPVSEVPDADRGIPVFDEAALLNRVLDDRDLARTVVRAFLGDIPDQLDALGDLVEAGDAVGGGARAHAIKGAAATVGGEAVCALALEMERAGRAGELEPLQVGLPALREAFKDLERAIEGSPLVARDRADHEGQRPSHTCASGGRERRDHGA